VWEAALGRIARLLGRGDARVKSRRPQRVGQLRRFVGPRR
jgi:hypothetical protein